MSARAMLNCWIVAMWLWLLSHGKTYIWLRRSHIFFGLVPHFGHTERLTLRRFRSVEYRPPKGKRWSKDDFVLAFSGQYVVTHFRIIEINRWATKEQALADTYFPKQAVNNNGTTTY